MEASNLIGYEGCFATRLRELMKKAKVTQQDLAASVGTTRQAISQYADGSVQPNIEKLYKIAEYFKVSADYLLGISEVTSSDVDTKAINKMLGLSEKSIERLKKARRRVQVYIDHGHVKNSENTLEMLYEYTKQSNITELLVINLLLEEQQLPTEYSVLLSLGDVFMHERDQDPNALFVLSKCTLLDGDTVEEKMIDNTTFLNNSDLIAVRLLKVQQAISRYKTELDERRTNGDK